MTAPRSTEKARISKAHREVLTLVADRTDERMPDPGMCTSSRTFADRYNVWVHWRTVRTLVARGLLRYTEIDPDVVAFELTEQGWAALGRTSPLPPGGES